MTQLYGCHRCQYLGEHSAPPDRCPLCRQADGIGPAGKMPEAEVDDRETPEVDTEVMVEAVFPARRADDQPDARATADELAEDAAWAADVREFDPTPTRPINTLARRKGES